MSSETPIEAYWNFFKSFNTRDAHQFSAALHYPHVRVSWRRDPRIVADAEAHALAQSWDQFIKTGWDHTEGAEPKVIQESPDKVHVEGGWTRMNAKNEPILSNRVVYIITRIDGSWGIQARYGIDPSPDDKPTEIDNATMQCVGWLFGQATANKEGVYEACAKPFYEIDVGAVKKVSSIDKVDMRTLDEPQLERVQSGSKSATYVVNSKANSSLLYLTRQIGWRIWAVSWL